MPSRADAAPAFLYVPALPDAGSTLALPDAEAHYLTRVCRVRVGEQVTATDGHGARARLTLLGRGAGATARVDALARERPGPETWLLCGAPEGQRADWMVEKLAELGVSRLVPIQTARARWRDTPARWERLDRLALAGLRQSRRTWRLELSSPLSLDEAIQRIPEGAARWLADEAGIAPPEPASEGLAVAAVGPAEGFEAAERDRLLASRFRPILLAGARLRCETAALAVAAWWSVRAI